MTEKLTVTALNNRVKDLLTSHPGLSDIFVVGEISNFKLYSSGHCYFTLKDSGAAVSAVMFRSARARIDFEPTDSMKVEAFGHVDLYPQNGKYQFVVEMMKKSGVGELYQEYERLKKKLEAEGLFDKQRKRALPRYPKVIGVVTSPTGAVIHDILTTTKRLYPADILLAPAKVQGEGAAKSIIDGIELLNRAGVDVIIVGRGGGSIEDLWAFNEEPVVRAIAASKVPVISSVGHETDVTLADFAADVRAPTPTGAAELAVRDQVEIRREISDLMRRAGGGLYEALGRMHLELDAVSSKIDPYKAEQMVGMHHLRLDELSGRADHLLEMTAQNMHLAFGRISTRPEAALKEGISAGRHRAEMAYARAEPAINAILAHSRSSLVQLYGRPEPAFRSMYDRKHALLSSASAGLDALNPYQVLDRGYSFVAGEDGRAITSVDGLQIGSEVSIHMRDGRARAEIKGKEKHDGDTC